MTHRLHCLNWLSFLSDEGDCHLQSQNHLPLAENPVETALLLAPSPGSGYAAETAPDLACSVGPGLCSAPGCEVETALAPDALSERGSWACPAVEAAVEAAEGTLAGRDQQHTPSPLLCLTH